MVQRKGLRGNLVKQERERLHLTQGEFAVALGITTDPESKAAKTTISRYENDHTQPLSDTLDRMADVLNVSVDYLLGRTEDRTGTVTLESLPSDEIEVLHAYRQRNLGKLVDLGIKKHDESPGDEPT